MGLLLLAILALLLLASSSFAQACGTVETGQSPDACRACIGNTGPPCTCNPATASAGTKASATQAKAESCGYTMPAASNPVQVSDVKDCIGYSNTPPSPARTATFTLRAITYSGGYYTMGSGLLYNSSGGIIGYYSTDRGAYDWWWTCDDEDAAFQGGLALHFFSSLVSSVDSVTLIYGAADDGYVVWPDYVTPIYVNWNCGGGPGISGHNNAIYRVGPHDYSIWWNLHDWHSNGGQLDLTFQVAYNVPTTAAYEYADLTYSTEPRPSRSPPMPGTPAIASAELSHVPPYQLTTVGHAQCTANCPPSEVPKDPEGGSDSAMQYRWFKNGAAMGSWGDYAPLDCNGVCSFQDNITLKSRACGAQRVCDPPEGACNESASTALIVQYAPPEDPAAPVLAPLGTALTVKTSAHCSGCPPSPMPIDYATGNPAGIEYSWVKNGVAEGWTTAYADYSCLSKGCTEGNTLLVKMRACNSANPSLCTSDIFSNQLVVSEAVEGMWGAAVDMRYCVYALGAAIAALALAFMASYVFNLPHIRPIIQDEGLQVLATGAVLLSIVGVNMFIDGYMVSALGVATGGSTSYAGITNAMDAAANTLSGMEGKASAMYTQFESTSNDLGREASKGIYCSFLGVGFSLVNCSPFNAFRGSITTAAFATSAALADVYAQEALLSLARNAAFAFFIPLGLFFRCFKTSRQAGGALIAIGFGFYTAYPIMIVATENLLHGSNYSSPAGMPAVGT